MGKAGAICRRTGGGGGDQLCVHTQQGNGRGTGRGAAASGVRAARTLLRLERCEPVASLPLAPPLPLLLRRLLLLLLLLVLLGLELGGGARAQQAVLDKPAQLKRGEDD